MSRRNTIQKSLVLDAVKKLHCHATASEVYDMVVRQHPHISRATIYRNLNLLSELGKIRKLEMLSEAERFDHLTHEHYHAKCTTCGQIADVEMKLMPDIANNIKNCSDFEFTGHEIIFNGICQKCKTRKGELL